MSSSAYEGTVEIILRSKAFEAILFNGTLGFTETQKQESDNPLKIFFLTVCHFFDTLQSAAMRHS